MKIRAYRVTFHWRLATHKVTVHATCATEAIFKALAIIGAPWEEVTDTIIVTPVKHVH